MGLGTGGGVSLALVLELKVTIKTRQRSLFGDIETECLKITKGLQKPNNLIFCNILRLFGIL